MVKVSPFSVFLPIPAELGARGEGMSEQNRIRIAIQKSGRLSEKSTELLAKCGLDFDWAKDRLFCRCQNFPLDLMLVRDDDIPSYVSDGVCDLGIVGFNVLVEKLNGTSELGTTAVKVARKLDFGKCRLDLAVPNESKYEGFEFFQGIRIATSYPNTLRRFLDEHKIAASIVEISGSVEIAPALKIADAVCDLVSTGTTLKSNGLRRVATVLESESVLVETRRPLSVQKSIDIARLLERMQGVSRATQTKYIMMNAPANCVERIRTLLPGMEEPTIVPLGKSGKVAIHAVAHESIFWETMENLKCAGASSILVLPIEKIIG